MGGYLNAFAMFAATAAMAVPLVLLFRRGERVDGTR
jgi:hypothetical protein